MRERLSAALSNQRRRFPRPIEVAIDAEHRCALFREAQPNRAPIAERLARLLARAHDNRRLSRKTPAHALKLPATLALRSDCLDVAILRRL
jgi:hypothetical protein